MSMSTGGGGPGSMLTEINVTPLVDVMLVLLIIFMVTAPMLQTGVDVNLPQAKAQTIPDDEGKLILTVTKDKRVFLGKLQIPWDDVEKVLKNNAKLNADHELYLHADRALSYGDVVKVMAAVKQAGVDKLGMVTDPLE
jgi:biopolymer transport protein TolR